MTRTPALALALVLAASALDAGAGEPVPPKPAKAVPATTVLRMPVTKDPLRALRGRVVLMILFDTRYERCAEAAPDMIALNDRLGPRGLSILWVAADEEKDAVQAWMDKHSLRQPAAIVDTATKEKILQRDYPAPGFPWSYLIDAEGKVFWAGKPQSLKDAEVETAFDATTAPPTLPESLAPAQAELDAGTWAKARATLQAAVDGGKLTKIDAGWAKGTIRWIDMRRPKILAEADALAAKEWWWDAWWTWDDFTRRYEGMEGADVARTKADEVRKNPAAQADLVIGDDIVKAKDFMAKGKPVPAKLILERISKLKPTRFAERAKELLPSVK